MGDVNRPRISIDVTPELRRRIRLAAAARDMSVTEYCRVAIEGRLGLDRGNGEDGEARSQRTRATVAGLRDMQQRIFGGRRLTTSSAELIREAREERLAELP